MMEGRRSWDGVPLGESHSPPQSVPGRRTPLGAVGLGGFYMQGGQPPPPQHCYPTDENQPEPGTSYAQRYISKTFKGIDHSIMNLIRNMCFTQLLQCI